MKILIIIPIPNRFQDVVMKCWEENPENRLDFSSIVHKIMCLIDVKNAEYFTFSIANAPVKDTRMTIAKDTTMDAEDTTATNDEDMTTTDTEDTNADVTKLGAHLSTSSMSNCSGIDTEADDIVTLNLITN